MNAARKRFDILAVGYACVDYVAAIDLLPQRDEKIMGERITVQGGGLAATAMVAAARLGARTALIATIAADPVGAQIAAELQRENVDLSFCPPRPDGESAFAFVMVEKSGGSRTIVGIAPTAPPLSAAEIYPEAIRAARVLFIDGTSPPAQRAAAEAARAEGVPVIIDAEGRGAALMELAALCDVVIGSREFGAGIGESADPAAAARAIQGRCAAAAAGITAGAGGAFFHTAEGAFHQPAYAVEVADTTGAGDAFHGAYSYGMALGWAPRDCARLAAAVAAMKCRKPGGRSGLPGMEEVRAFLAERGEELPAL